MPKNQRADVCIALPTYDGKFCIETQLSLEKMQAYSQKKGLTLARSIQLGSNLPRSRHGCVRRAQAVNAEYILFVDADIVFKPDALINLLARKVDIVSGLYFGKQSPFTPIAYHKRKKVKKGEYDLESFEAIDGGALFDDLHEVGAGLLLIKMSVFDKMPPPYFNFRWIPEVDDFGGEDGYFCRKAKQNGFKIHLDTMVRCGHVGNYIYTENDFTGFRDIVEQVRQANAAKEETPKPKILVTK